LVHASWRSQPGSPGSGGASPYRAGVDVTAVRYEGLIHDYGLLNALSEVPAVRDALHQAAEMLRKHLK
jgi:acetyl esterase/lipase